MKKILPLLSTFFILSLFFPAFSLQVNAQPKNIATCEEWKDIYGTQACPTTAHWQDKKEIWCYDPKEAESYPGGTGKYVGDYLLQGPPTHTVEFDYDACIEEWGNEKGSSFSPPNLLSETQPIETPKEQEKKSVVQTLDDWIRENHLEYNPKNVAPKPSQLHEEMFTKAKQKWQSAIKPLGVEESKFDFVWEGQWPNVKAVVIDKESGIILQSDDWGKPYLQELADEATSKVMAPFLESPDELTKKVIFQQGEMEVKVINNNPTKNKVSVEVDDFFDIFVIQTHFRVEYDPDKKLAQVDVYEGEVEVKTKDGKVIKVKPNGDEPGVLVITKKLSLGKLAFVGVILVAIIGGLTFFFKRKKRK